MCGRYFFHLEEHSAFVKLKKKLEQMNMFEYASDEVFPSNKALVLIDDKLHDYTLAIMKWGIEGFKGHLLINARSERIDEKKTFKTMLNQRCLIPCNGFFEWTKKAKQKIYVRVQDEPLFYLTGIYNRNEEFVIITGESQNNMRDIHARTPIILHEEDVIPYLSGKLPFQVDNEHLVLIKAEQNNKKHMEQLGLFDLDEGHKE